MTFSGDQVSSECQKAYYDPTWLICSRAKISATNHADGVILDREKRSH